METSFKELGEGRKTCFMPSVYKKHPLISCGDSSSGRPEKGLVKSAE
jgi:hypothetical protein